MSTTEKKRKKRKAELRNSPDEDPDFQIAPMIDVLLVLLVFFMSISSTEVLSSVKGIELPVAAAGKDSEKNAGQVIINVTWLLGVGGIEISEQRFSSPQDIKRLLTDARTANPLVRVLIRADKTVRFEFMREVMRAAAESGIGNVTFSVVDKAAETES